MQPVSLSPAVVTLCLLSALVASAPAAESEARLKLVPSGVTAKIGGYYPLRLAIAAEQPDHLKKLPKEVSAPLFGTLKLGPAEAPQNFAVLLDEPEGQPARLFVDSNGNGDLTDDPAAEWTSRAVKGSDGKVYSQYSGAAKVALRLDGETQEVTLKFYRFDKRDPARAALASAIFHYPDYGREGEVKVGEKTYQAMLVDRRATGDFRGKASAENGVQLFLDLNESGRFEAATEAFHVREPFNVAGQTYELAGLTAGGGSFHVQKSAKVAPEKKAAPRPELLAAGQPAKVFKAKRTDGTEVDFPASYKGKIVLLDFWATWCGPCIGELPHLTAAYEKFHAKGFEVLGISLDRAGDEKKLANFTKEKNMPWPQVFDGKYWQAEVAALYGVRSIPTAYLVDGDTGQVIANSGLRGSELEKTIEAALAKKNAAAK